MDIIEISEVYIRIASAPSAVALSGKQSKYNLSLKWSKAVTVSPVKVARYEVSINGQIVETKSTSYTLKDADLGNYDIMVRAVDSEGHTGEWSNSMKFIVSDVTAPVVKFKSTVVDGYTLDLSWEGSDKKGAIQSYSVYYDGQFRETLAPDRNSLTLQLSEADVGKHKIEIVAFDGYNYSKKVSKTVTVKDATPPEKVWGLSTPAADAKYKVALAWVPAMDNSGKIARYEIQVDDGKIYKSTKASVKISNSELGEHTYRVRAIDKAGNVGEWSDDAKFSVFDMTPPTVSIKKAEVSGYYLDLIWKGTDKIGEIQSFSVYCDGILRETLSAGQSSTVLTFTEAEVGKHTIEVIAYDGYNYSETAKKTVTVKDSTPPEKAGGLSIPVVDAKYKATFSWAPGVDNSGKIARYEIMLSNGRIYKSTKTSLSVSGLAVGDYAYQVRAVDKAGNIGEWSELLDFTVRDVTAPSKVSAKAAVAGNTVSLSWSPAKDNVGVVGYEVWTGATASEMSLESYLSWDRLNYDLNGIPKGNLFYGIRAVDAAGNRSELKVSKAQVKTELMASVTDGLMAALWNEEELSRYSGSFTAPLA